MIFDGFGLSAFIDVVLTLLARESLSTGASVRRNARPAVLATIGAHRCKRFDGAMID